MVNRLPPTSSDLLLDLFRVKARHCIWLDLEVLIKLFHISDEVVYCLRFLLLLGKWDLHHMAVHAFLILNVG